MGSTESDEFQDQVSLKISELLTDGSPESIATVVKLVDKASEKIGRKVAQDMIQPFGSWSCNCKRSRGSKLSIFRIRGITSCLNY